MQQERKRLLIGGVLALAFVVGWSGPALGQDFFDSFEDYALGSFPPDPPLPVWDTWTSDPTGQPQEYGAITTDQAASGAQSLVIDSDNDIVCLLSQVNSGVWTIRAKYLLPNDHAGTAYFIIMNFQSKQNIIHTHSMKCIAYRLPSLASVPYLAQTSHLFGIFFRYIRKIVGNNRVTFNLILYTIQ